MKKSSKPTRLSLDKETLRTLQSAELALVAGGVVRYSKSCDDMFCAAATTV
jgi:hypothetical protein